MIVELSKREIEIITDLLEEKLSKGRTFIKTV